MPVLLGLSMFTVLLAVVAGVRRVWMPDAERFVVVRRDGGSGQGWGVVEMVAGATVAARAARAKAVEVGWREWV